MLQPAFLATLAAPKAVANAEWRWTILSSAIGAILLAIGFIAASIFVFRKQTRDRTLLYFGIFVIVYAIRIVLRDPVILSGFGISPAVAGHIIRAITFTIALPTLFMFLEVVQTDWRRVILWALALQLVFAPFAILCDVFGVARRAVDISNSLLVLAFWILLIVFFFVFRPPGRELHVVAVGLIVFSLFVLHANLVGLGVLPGRDVEPVGFLFFVCTLGYLVAQRVFAKEESLFAIQKELEIAEQIQTSILPRAVPRLAGLEIAARYLPMGAVAGDFYDFVMSENQLGILVADVTGHGVPAALIASMLKVAFAGQKVHAHHPERVLVGLNEALCGKFEEHFVTAAYLYFDLETKIIRYAGAGHPPVLFSSRSNGDACLIEQNGTFLGMFPEAAYSSLEIPLNPGDRYVVYTDGLPESKNTKNEEFGLARCKQFLQSHALLTASGVADELIDEIARWSARSSSRLQEDDTLIVIDCQEQS